MATKYGTKSVVVDQLARNVVIEGGYDELSQVFQTHSLGSPRAPETVDLRCPLLYGRHLLRSSGQCTWPARWADNVGKRNPHNKDEL